MVSGATGCRVSSEAITGGCGGVLGRLGEVSSVVGRRLGSGGHGVRRPALAGMTGAGR